LITDTFNSLGDVGWYGAAFLLASATSQLFYGKLYRFWYARIVFSLVVLIFALGNLVCALSRSSPVFTAGRAISGLGSAGVLSGTNIIISRVVPVRQRPICLGAIGALESLAIAIGPLLGGLIADTIGWRWCFWLCLPLAGITIFITLVFLRSDDVLEEATMPLSSKLSQLDIGSMALFVPSVVCLVLALQWGGSQFPWSNWRIVLLCILSFCLLLAFASLQWRNGNDATVPPKIFLTRTVCFGALYSFNTAGSLNITCYYVRHTSPLQLQLHSTDKPQLPIWFQAIKSTSAFISGVYGLPLVLSLTFAVLASGTITSSIGYYNPTMYIGTILMCAGAGMLSVLRSNSRPALWISCQIVYALGAGFGFQQPIIAAQTNFSGKNLPTALVLMSFVQTIGGVVAISVAQSVFSNSLSENLGESMMAGDADVVLDTGILSLKNNFGGEDLARILPVYNLAVTKVFLVAAAMAAFTAVGSFGMPWRSVKGKKEIGVGVGS
jgi:MFS family permease